MKTINICSVSGGKDSTALYLLMQEFHGDDFLPIFADTGHEHPVTLNYIRNLSFMTGGPEVQIVEGNFTKVLAKKRHRMTAELAGLLIRASQPSYHDESAKEYDRLLQYARNLTPSGHTFLDMAMWKGRAPSTKAQFCTEHLKLWPIKLWLLEHYPQDEFEWVMHTGIRAGESKKRSSMQPFMVNDFFDCMSVLPMLYNDENFEFEYLESKGIPPNPLYALGFGRVGCFPCIHCNKEELMLLPDWAWERLEFYEARMARMARSWFGPNIVPGIWIPTVAQVRDWCRTTPNKRGNQFNMFRTAPEDTPSCMTGWIACE